jgi:hypothetical protein
MISTHNIDPGSALHPSSRGYPIFVPAASAASIVAAIAENNGAHIPGAFLTLVTSGTTGIGPAGYIAGAPCKVAFTPSAAVTAVYDVVGIDQFGKQVTERVSVAAAVVWTVRAYKQILSIQVVSDGGSANTVSVGINLTAGFGIGLPFRPSTNLVGTTTLASFQAKIEVVGLVTPAGTAFVQLAASAAVNEQYATLTFGATVTAGLNWLVTNYLQRGFREK